MRACGLHSLLVPRSLLVRWLRNPKGKSASSWAVVAAMVWATKLSLTKWLVVAVVVLSPVEPSAVVTNSQLALSPVGEGARRTLIPSSSSPNRKTNSSTVSGTRSFGGINSLVGTQPSAAPMQLKRPIAHHQSQAQSDSEDQPRRQIWATWNQSTGHCTNHSSSQCTSKVCRCKWWPPKGKKCSWPTNSNGAAHGWAQRPKIGNSYT